MQGLQNYLFAACLAITLAACDEETVFITQTVESQQKISATQGNFNGTLAEEDNFGSALALIGDLEADGVVDLAVGAPLDDDAGAERGAVWILFMNTDGTVDMEQKISATAGDFGGSLGDDDRFGEAIASLGDLNGDGFIDIAVGAPLDDDGGTDRGAVWIVFLQADGTVFTEQKISATDGGFGGALDDGDQFGAALAALGDLDGDGVADLAVGAPFDDDGDTDTGAVWILFLNADGSVKAEQKISADDGDFTGVIESGDAFGDALADTGALAVGAPGDDDGGTDRGAIWMLFLGVDGKVATEQKISSTEGMFEGTLAEGDGLGQSLANAGDVDSNGIDDLLAGLPGTDTMWTLFLANDGTVIEEEQLTMAGGSRFGKAVAGIGNLGGGTAVDFATGAPLDDDGGTDQGAVWVQFLDTVQVETACESSSTEIQRFFGILVCE